MYASQQAARTDTRSARRLAVPDVWRMFDPRGTGNRGRHHGPADRP